MGAMPEVRVRMDLNGDGVLVDVTSYVDQGAGVSTSRGRDKWTDDPKPGSVTFTLDNTDGRFTPGRVGVYRAGVRPGTLVEVRVGGVNGRAVMYRADEPTLTFGSTSPGSSSVSVTGYDALRLLAGRKLRAPLVEHNMAWRPVAYWPLTDKPEVGEARDISGRGAQPLTVASGAEDYVGWGKGTGPATDGASAVMFEPLLPATTTTAPATLVMEQQPIDLTSLVSSTDPDRWVFAVSFWLNIKTGVYDTTAGGAATDGPLVPLVQLGRSEFGLYHPDPAGPADQPQIMQAATIHWRPKSRALVWQYHGVRFAIPLTTSITPGFTYHVLLTVAVTASTGRWVIRPWVNGTPQAPVTFAPAISLFAWRPVATGVSNVWNGQYAGTDTQPLSGTLSHLSVYGPESVQLDSSAATSPASVATFIPSYDYPFAGYAIGMGRARRAADLTFGEISSWLRSRSPVVPIGFAATGVSPATGGYLLGPIATDGGSLLDALAAVVRSDGGQIEARLTTGGAETVFGRFYSTQRTRASLASIDAERDASGLPDFRLDASTAVGAAQVTGPLGSTAGEVRVTDPTVSGTYPDEASLATGLSSDAARRDLASWRLAMGRPTRTHPVSLTVDLATAPSAAGPTVAWVLTLLRLWVGENVTVTNLPPSVFGPDVINGLLCTVIGVDETFALGRAELRFTVIPHLGDDYVGDPDVRLDLPAEARLVASGVTDPGTAGPVGAADISVDYVALAGNELTVDPDDYPMLFVLDDEVLTVAAAPGAPVLIAGGFVRQALTVTRGQYGTTAAAHSAVTVPRWFAAGPARDGGAFITY